MKVQQNNTDTILPITSGLVWTSDDESVVKLSDDGNRFEFVGVGEAHLIVTVPEHEISGDPDNSYASASGTVTVMVTPKSISVDPSSVEIKDRAYNGKKEVAVKAALQQSMIIKGDDVTVTAAGMIEDANADAAKKKYRFIMPCRETTPSSIDWIRIREKDRSPLPKPIHKRQAWKPAPVLCRSIIKKHKRIISIIHTIAKAISSGRWHDLDARRLHV